MRSKLTWQWLGLLLVAIGLLAAVAACGDDDDGGDATATPSDGTPAATGEPTDPPDAEPETIILGAAFELSGNFQALGEAADAGFQIAVDEINEAGGFQVGDQTYVFEVVKEDLRSDATIANAVFEGLIEDDGAQFIFGPNTGPVFASVNQVTQEAGVIHIAPGYKADDAFQEDVESGAAEFRFKTSPPQFLSSEALVAGIVEFFPDAETAHILFPDDANGNLFAPTQGGLLEDEGLSVNTTLYDPTATDFTVPLTAIKSESPDVLLYGLGGAAATTILRQSVELDVTQQYAGFGAAVDDALENAIGGPIDQPAVFYLPPRDLNNPLTDKEAAFAESLAEHLGKERFTTLDGVALYQYDFVYMLVEALKAAGTVDDLEAIADALETVTYDGVLGDGLTFGSIHEVNVTEVTVCKVEAGETDCRLLP